MKFGIDLSKDSFIRSIKFILLSDNNQDYFEIDNYEIDISSTIVSNGIQEINIDTTRGYNNELSGLIGIVQVRKLELNNNIQYYQVLISQLIQHKEWEYNEDVDTVFYDNTKPNNNLNRLSSNYSDENNYFTKLGLLLTLSGIDDEGNNIEGNYLISSGEVFVNSYNDPSFWNTSIVTRDIDTDSELIDNGVYMIYSDKDTIFESIHEPKSGTITLDDVEYVIHRLEINNSLSDVFTIDKEASLSLVGNAIVARTTIDQSSIRGGFDYKLSCRVN